MRIIKLFFLVFLFNSKLLAQLPTFEISEIEHPNSTISLNPIFYQAAIPYQTTERSFIVKNISNVSQTISIKKSETLLHTINNSDKAEAFFCTGVTCYASSVFTGAMVLNAGQTAVFKAQLIEASNSGESTISYKFVNNSTNESNTLTLRYNSPLAGVSKLVSRAAEPNYLTIYQSNNGECLNIVSLEALNNTMLQIRDTKGTLIYTQKINSEEYAAVILLENLTINTGVYFVSIISANNTKTKKVIIN